MKVLRFSVPENVRVDDVPDPIIEQPMDVIIIKITSSAICCSDLHLYDGLNPTVKDGNILGHEFMGDAVVAAVDMEASGVGIGELYDKAKQKKCKWRQ